MWKTSIGLFAATGLGFIVWYDGNLKRKYPEVPLSFLPQQMKMHRVMQDYNNNLQIEGYFDARCVKILKSSFPNAQSKARNLLFFFGSKYFWIEFRMIGNSKSQFKDPKEYVKGAIVGGIFTILEKPDDSLLVSWEVPSRYVELGEKLAGRGLPYRIMNGGIHELFVQDDGDDYVTLWFACAHNTTRGNDSKRGPKLLLNFHLLYANMLLDSAVKNIKAKYQIQKS